MPEGLAPSRGSDCEGADDVVDVVIPIYNNFADAQRLFTHLAAASNETACRLVIVDDASSQTTDLRLPEAGGYIEDVCFSRNAANLGFAATVNQAMRLGRSDVVLLNTDTLVFDGWLDRLRAVSRSRPAVGTVTPFSNAATILSYPTFPHEFKSELEIAWRELDALFAERACAPVAIPTGVGFCMLITRHCLDAVGFFDEVTFRRGYGEECDFCRRAASAGWSNLAATDLFVWHRGEGSFGGRAQQLRDEAQRALRSRHPDYPSLVATFIANDPLAAARRAVDFARITRDARPARLHLRIGPPDAAGLTGKEIFFGREGRAVPRYRPQVHGFAALPNLPTFTMTTANETLRDFLIDANISEVIAYANIGLSSLALRRFRRVARRLGLPISHIAR